MKYLLKPGFPLFRQKTLTHVQRITEWSRPSVNNVFDLWSRHPKGLDFFFVANVNTPFVFLGKETPYYDLSVEVGTPIKPASFYIEFFSGSTKFTEFGSISTL